MKRRKCSLRGQPLSAAPSALRRPRLQRCDRHATNIGSNPLFFKTPIWSTGPDLAYALLQSHRIKVQSRRDYFGARRSKSVRSRNLSNPEAAALGVFLLKCYVKSFGHSSGANPARFHLIAPYETVAQLWLKKTWIDQYLGKEYKITTMGHYGDRRTARVKTYGDVVVEYKYHPESKHADAHGKEDGQPHLSKNLCRAFRGAFPLRKDHSYPASLRALVSDRKGTQTWIVVPSIGLD
jgi:hypothetical protein